MRKFANPVNGFTGFFRATPPALILPLADVKIDVQGSPHRKKPVNPSPDSRIFSPLFRKEWYVLLNDQIKELILYYRTDASFQNQLKKGIILNPTDYILPTEICAMVNVVIDAKNQSFKLCSIDGVDVVSYLHFGTLIIYYFAKLQLQCKLNWIFLGCNMRPGSQI